MQLHAHTLAYAQIKLHVLLVTHVKGHLHVCLVSLPMRWNGQFHLLRTPQAPSTNFFKIYPAHFRLIEDQGIFSLSSDFLKEGEVLKPAKHRKFVCISFENMCYLNNHNRLKASNTRKKHIKASLSTHRWWCVFFCPKELDE